MHVARSRQQTGRGGALRRALPAVLATAAVLAVPTSAWAHAVVQPGTSRPADLQRYSLTVPSESPQPTVEVSMQVPDGIDFLLVQNQAGWKVTTTRRGDRIAVVRWSGGRITKDHFETFQFIARNPVRTGPIDWKVVQTYTDQTVRWIGPPGSNSPAARIEISESAPRVDVVNVEEGGSEQGDAAQTGATATDDGGEEDDDDGTDWIPIALGAVALVVSVAALIIARRRPA
jgi:periplasmic copper chaperone A